MAKNLNIMIIAGEVSGDMHAGRLVAAVRAKRPDISFFGIGGDTMRAAGVETLYDIKDMAVMGFSEVIRRYGFFRRVFNEMVALARERRPDAVIFVDYPGFNLRLARKTHAVGLKNIYHICPQVWAWNRARIPRMAEMIDQLITIFPFEKRCFEGTGLKVDFVGHPLAGETEDGLNLNSASMSTAESRPNGDGADVVWQGDARVAILPGSRRHEIERILPVMWSASAIIDGKRSDASFVIAAPSEEIAGYVHDVLGGLGDGPARWSIAVGCTRRVLREARAAMVASGTATVETAIAQCPMVIAYKMASFSYLLCKRLVKVDSIGMVNIIAGKRVCPEFIQSEATPAALAGALDPLLEDNAERAAMVEELAKVRESLGGGGVEERAADIVLRVLDMT